MLINNALMGGESEVAMAWSRRLAQYPTLLPTGAYGDASADWTHLPLVQVGLVLRLGYVLRFEPSVRPLDQLFRGVCCS